MTGRETFRLAPPVVLWWVWLAFVALNVADYAVQGLPSARFGAVLGAALLLVTGLAYSLALRPRVLAGGDGITVVNPFRTHVVPWTLVRAVGAGAWVDVRVEPAADSPGKPGGDKLHCWGLYVSARARRKVPGRPPSRARGFGLRGMSSGHVGESGPGARLPEDARYLASLPPARAMAERLDRWARRERAAAAGAGGGGGAAGVAGLAAAVRSAWCWPAIAAVVVPALLLIGVVAGVR